MSLHSSEQYLEVQIISAGVPKITLKYAEQTYSRKSSRTPGFRYFRRIIDIMVTGIIRP